MCSETEYDVEPALRRAIQDDEFRLHFQPKVALDTDRIVGVEVGPLAASTAGGGGFSSSSHWPRRPASSCRLGRGSSMRPVVRRRSDGVRALTDLLRAPC